MLVAAMSRMMMTRRGIIQWMRRRCATPRGNRLRASHMQRRLAGYLGAEPKTNTAMTASFLRHRAQRVALGMITRPAAWTAGHSGGGNCDDTHVFILAAGCAATGSIRVSGGIQIRTLNS